MIGPWPIPMSTGPCSMNSTISRGTVPAGRLRRPAQHCRWPVSGHDALDRLGPDNEAEQEDGSDCSANRSDGPVAVHGIFVGLNHCGGAVRALAEARATAAETPVVDLAACWPLPFRIVVAALDAASAASLAGSGLMPRAFSRFCRSATASGSSDALRARLPGLRHPLNQASSRREGQTGPCAPPAPQPACRSLPASCGR
jgi:hypothetical protein